MKELGADVVFDYRVSLSSTIPSLGIGLELNLAL